MFLPYDAWISLDAALRTIGRLLFTRRNLLEWQTASDAEQRSAQHPEELLRDNVVRAGAGGAGRRWPW